MTNLVKEEKSKVKKPLDGIAKKSGVGSFLVRQEKFEGPLELLLELISKQKVSVSEISLANVTNEYVSHIQSLEKIDPAELAEFLVVAATLILVKSRSLLPSLSLTEEEEESIEELEARLKEYKTIRELAGELGKLAKSRRWSVSREPYKDFETFFYSPPKLTAKRMADAFAALLESLPKVEKLAKDTIRRVISLQERIGQIRTSLQERIEKSFSELIGAATDKIDIIISFLAILELAKQKLIAVDQKKLFEDITVREL